ncbi:HDA1 complex subunit 3 [Wickerhamomyces ciferrii]|uniref:HDA1 complex subunit 3 n=1 Tax=Wickerhamomyces ciferrii (strain ATCC 14091 / BCRC 22168 / CBS 111 / JCM 3599 / NBRC 0793 / NRRL Y-1031 F-60-10) TaxID=1206466 RepID=K0KHZ1_WICCF|nr:HDA1 complex subunit 3 [Wickerhamomyces ciferrii]CCH42641.1 HDA1 complex subunit 3 [Wickerhamomyces ciferrii]
MDLFKILDTTPEPPIVNLNTSLDTSGDYWLAVPMNEYQKELTDQVVSLHYSDILKYFETDDKDRVLLDSLELLYLNSQLVATHPYLLINHYLPKNLTSKDIPFNLCETSGKFQVLRDVITLVEETKLNIAIVARSGKLLDLIEALLLGCKTNIKRHYGNYIKDPAKAKQRDLTCHIIPSDVDIDIKDKFDLVFSLDITSQNDFLNSLKADPKSPILRFVSANSIDHVALYFRQFPKERYDYLVDVTAAIVVLRDRVGILPPDLRPIYTKKLTYLKDWFKDFKNNPWPLPELSPIKKYDSEDVEKSLLSEVYHEKQFDQLTPKFKSYYETKRLNRDYTSNPLKDVTFGILSVNSNYTETLTHKLIQEFNVLHNKLAIQCKEFEHFEQFQSNEKNYLLNDESKLITELDHVKTRINTANNKSSKLINKIEESKNNVLDLENKVENLQTKHEKLTRIENLKNEILREEQKKKSTIVENDYMLKEINTAKNSIIESNKNIEDFKKSILSNETKLDELFKDVQNTPIESEDLTKLQEQTKNIKLKIEENLKKLNTGRGRNSDHRRNSPSVK